MLRRPLAVGTNECAAVHGRRGGYTMEHRCEQDGEAPGGSGSCTRRRPNAVDAAVGLLAIAAVLIACRALGLFAHAERGASFWISIVDALWQLGACVVLVRCLRRRWPW